MPLSRFPAALFATALMLVAAASPARAQIGFDRPGDDYLRTTVDGDPADCAMLCERDRRCRSWSFSYPGSPASGGTCWLKGSVPPRKPSNCCVSGVRGAGVIEPRNAAIESAVDRFGGDYRSFQMKAADGDDNCKAACTGDGRCRAWTYARPGYVSRDAWCFLKSDIKPPQRKPGFVSGVVR